MPLNKILGFPLFEYFKSHLARQLFIRFQPFCHLHLLSWINDGDSFHRSHNMKRFLIHRVLGSSVSIYLYAAAASGGGGLPLGIQNDSFLLQVVGGIVLIGDCYEKELSFTQHSSGNTTALWQPPHMPQRHTRRRGGSAFTSADGGGPSCTGVKSVWITTCINDAHLASDRRPFQDMNLI